MGDLRIVAAHKEAVVPRGDQATSISIAVSGLAVGETPAFRASSPSGGPSYPWISLHVVSSALTTAAAVVFDRSAGPPPKPGAYPVVVTVEAGGRHASTTVRFVVERHPCLVVRAAPSIAFDPLTATATLKVQLWSCGNVDLDVGWSARLRGRRVEIQPANVVVSAKGGIVDSSVSFVVPDGSINVDSDLDLEAISEAGTTKVLFTRRDQARDHGTARRLLLAATGVLAIVLLAAGVATSKWSDGGQTINVGPGTEVPPTSVTATSPSAPATVPTTMPTTVATTPTTVATTPATRGGSATTGSSDPPPPAKIVVVDGAARKLEVLLGDQAQVTFEIEDQGGRPADLEVTMRANPKLFDLPAGGCGGRLEAGQHCTIAVVFRADAPGPFVAVIGVRDRSTGEELSLRVDATALAFDLAARFDSAAIRTSGCPGQLAECLAFTISNLGSAKSPATVADVASGGTSTQVDVPPIDAGSSVGLFAPVVIACNPDCSATVMVDPLNAIRELDEANNSDNLFFIG